jgi:hypothetical protein
MATQQTPPAKSADPAVEAELDRLAVMPIAQLRVRYREVFRADPPKAFGPDLLRRSVAHRIQEKAYGGLSRSTQRLLDQMMKAFSAKPNGKIVLPRRIKTGSILVREWKGRSHRVMVLADGFAYDGNTYSNLSEIAGETLGEKPGMHIQAPCLDCHRKIETERYQGRDAHLIEQHAHRALHRAIDGSSLLRGAPVDRGVTFRQIPTNAQTAAERLLKETVPAAHKA